MNCPVAECEGTNPTTTEIDFSNNPYRNVIQIMLMPIAIHSLTVMKSIPSQRLNSQQHLDQTHGLRQTLIGYALLYGMFLIVLLAISYPIVVVGILAFATTAGLGVHVHRVAVSTSPVAAVSQLSAFV